MHRYVMSRTLRRIVSTIALRYLAQATHSYFSVSTHLSNLSNFPENDSLRQLAAGLAEGWRAYGKDDAAVLFVVQEGERNVFDQRWLEFELLEAYVHDWRHAVTC